MQNFVKKIFDNFTKKFAKNAKFPDENEIFAFLFSLIRLTNELEKMRAHLYRKLYQR